jgi:hypothetical protein
MHGWEPEENTSFVNSKSNYWDNIEIYLRNELGECRSDTCGSGWGSMLDCYEFDSEILGSMKPHEVLN